MSLTTPEAIRTLQRKLYGKAKTEPGFRFYLLYDKVWRADILRHAYDLARANKGAPGVDGATFERIEAAGLEDWLIRLGEELRAKAYQCQPVRRVMIPKPGGGERPLGIPTIRDRVVQTAAKLVLEPIFEAALDPTAYGYRPRRSATEAIQLVLTLLRRGYTDVVDADLSKYFDTIPHRELMQSIARRIVDTNMLRLIKQWLQAPVEITDGDGTRRMAGGKAHKLGVPPAFAGAGSGRRDQSAGRQPLHEPLSEALASERPGRGLAGACHQLRGRLRHPQSRSCGRGPGVDRSCDGTSGIEPEPDENLRARCTQGTVRLPGLQLRAALLPADRTLVHRGQPIEEERAASEGQGGGNPGSGEPGVMGRGARHSEPLVAGLVWLLQPWLTLHHGPGDRGSPV